MDEKNNNHKKAKFTLAYIMSLPYTWMIFGYVIGKFYFSIWGSIIGLIIGYVFSIKIFRIKAGECIVQGFG